MEETKLVPLSEEIAKQFDMEDMFAKYCIAANIDTRSMMPFQVKQIRMGFYGGIGQILLLMTMQKLSIPQINEAINLVLTQVNGYWTEVQKPKN